MELISQDTKVTTVVTNTYQTAYEGITVVERITNDDKPSYEVKAIGPHKTKIAFVKPEFWDFIKEKNPWQSYWNGKEHVYGWTDLFHDNLDLQTIETLLKEQQFIYYYGDGHQMFDANKKIIPYAKRFDYVGALFSNDVCKLDELLPYLKQHEWVINKDELTIESIPYYNCQKGRTKTISVVIRPDKDVYNEIYQKVKDTEYWSTKLDMYVQSYNLKEDFDPMGLMPFLKEKKN